MEISFYRNNTCLVLGGKNLVLFATACSFRIPMEEGMLSMISSGETNMSSDLSDSSSSNRPVPASKRARYGTHVCMKFKGVVQQHNGHWGAQIYANHERIWLGTYKSEMEAAMAYDSAAIKLRSGDCHRNFPWNEITVKEPKFQSLYCTEAIINFIRDGTYQSKFAEFITTYTQGVESEVAVNLVKGHTNKGLTCKQMFPKVLTPSDVGKLNRLVIPKVYAVEFFPSISASEEANAPREDEDNVQLEFYDRSMRLWKFRYCYWRSSQSFVFTRGWNKFVKEKQLKANDVIIFYSCSSFVMEKECQTFLMIDVYKGHTRGGVVEVKVANECLGAQMDLRLQLGRNIINDEERNAEKGLMVAKVRGDGSNKKLEEEEGLISMEPIHGNESKGFKLFGVQII
ncbi:AP2 domain-containing protein/B3 domain-containing protein [Cephalotus follicularis]|uniref:AP2 domain-containing protein/B3 domain-containing protein n=1 Tax=Cephalotus follicularis TaxID=3775 RepID=A0A1Q3CSS8_CEPFO|nr:AP2 domain-containing protein/B3 domain-containing protein [Cephalotus follicularis]